MVHRLRAGQGPQSVVEKMATIASLPCWVHGDQDAGRLALRAGDGLGVVVDGEVGAGVSLAGAGLRGGVGQQRPDQRDAPGRQR